MREVRRPPAADVHAGPGVAVGHTLPVIVYQVPRRREAYRELGADSFDRLQPERLTRHLVRRLERLGHKVTLEDRTAAEHTEQSGYFSEQQSPKCRGRARRPALR